MKKNGLFLLILCSFSFAQISLNGIGTYAENFNTLAKSGTSSTLPTGWFISESGTNANTTYTAGTGSLNTGDTYSFGSASDTDRALGGLQSGSLIPTFGAQFINNTGLPITQILIQYTGEEWRLGTASRVDRIDFQYSTDATSLTNGIWIDVDDLDFSTPNTTTTGSHNGNDSANQTVVAGTISGLNIPNGMTFWIRWVDFNASGSDDGLAVDDFSLDETALPVELTSFTAIAKGKTVELAWQTATEVNNYGFEIQRSEVRDQPARRSANESGTSERKWVKVGFVAGNGNSNSPKSYSFTDASARGKVAYRLKQIDNDGAFEYHGNVEVIAQMPQHYALMQNYPNPFNPATSIQYAVPSSQLVTLKVYDIIGRDVATLVNEVKEPGEYTVEFNAVHLPSGIYFYTLHSGNFTATKKLMLLK